MHREKITMVDEHDTVIGSKYRDEVDYSKDIYRSSGIWITNSKKQVLLAQRKHTKERDPGKWGCAVAGTVEEGETYEENAYKELKEELGIVSQSLILGPKQYIDAPRKQFYQWFLCSLDREVKELSLQENEVEQVMWVEAEGLILDIESNPEKYVPFMSKTVEILMGWKM